MNRRDVSFTFALCASLVLHALLSWAAAEMYVRDVGGWIWLPGVNRLGPAEADAPPLPGFYKDEDPRLRLGDQDGTGYAIDESPGDQPLQAREGLQDQPFLSRDPAGMGQVGDLPSEWTLAPGQGGSNAAPLPAPSFATEGPELAVGIPLPSEAKPPFSARNLEPEAQEVDDDPSANQNVRTEPEPPDSSENASTPSLAQPQPQAAAAAVTPPAVPAVAAPQVPGERPGRPGPPNSADPAPEGDSEIDPVSIIGSMDFRSGATSVRQGRKHKLIRPRLTLDARLDLLQLGSTVIVLKIRLDPAGNVTSSEVAKSSGSMSVDQIVKVTSYEWWFEPRKDDRGNPIPDLFLFSVRYH